MGNATSPGAVPAVWGFGGNRAVETGVLSGAITATVRTRREAEIGQCVVVRNLGLVVIVHGILQGPICDLIHRWHRKMGFDTGEDALKDWRRAHPYTDPSQNGYLYLFAPTNTTIGAYLDSIGQCNGSCL